MTFELPLFPLNTVLFPGMGMPLHVFEPRYRLMIRRCLEGDATFGVVLLAEEHETNAGPGHAAIGCSAHITASTPFSDGRMNIQTMGRRRFEILSQREEDDYLIGTCQWLDDDLAEPQAPLAARQVRAAVRRYLENLAQDVKITGARPEDIVVPDDPYWLSMWVASLISLTNPQKQKLLELTSTCARLAEEYSVLRRTEIVRQAWLNRAAGSQSPIAQAEGWDALSPFISLN